MCRYTILIISHQKYIITTNIHHEWLVIATFLPSCNFPFRRKKWQQLSSLFRPSESGTTISATIFEGEDVNTSIFREPGKPGGIIAAFQEFVSGGESSPNTDHA